MGKSIDLTIAHHLDMLPKGRVVPVIIQVTDPNWKAAPDSGITDVRGMVVSSDAALRPRG